MAEEQDKREQDTKEIKADRERSRSRERRKRAGDRDFRARSRSRSRDRRRSRSPRGGRDRDRDRDRRRRSRSRSRSRSGDRDRKSHRSRRNRFDDDSGSGSDREERRKKAAAAAPAAGTFPGPPGGAAAAAAAADPFAALRAANPALAGLDPTAASMLMRQQMMLQQQLLLQQQAALQAQQVMSKAASSQTATAAQRQQEKLLKAQRELFVGNLAPGAVTEASLYQVFHSALIAAFPQAAQPGQEPVLRVTLSGRFAFVEFRAPEYATAALQLNGQIALMGNTLKIARPASYVETPAGGMLGGLGGAVAPAAVGGGVPGLPGGLPGAPAVPGVAPGGVAGVSDPLATAMPTPFLCLTGMVTAGVLADDEEFREGCAVCFFCLPTSHLLLSWRHLSCALILSGAGCSAAACVVLLAACTARWLALPAALLASACCTALHCCLACAVLCSRPALALPLTGRPWRPRWLPTCSRSAANTAPCWRSRSRDRCPARRNSCLAQTTTARRLFSLPTCRPPRRPRTPSTAACLPAVSCRPSTSRCRATSQSLPASSSHDDEGWGQRGQRAPVLCGIPGCDRGWRCEEPLCSGCSTALVFGQPTCLLRLIGWLCAWSIVQHCGLGMCYSLIIG